MLDGPFRGSEAIRRGALTRARLRGRRFRRVFPDVYVPTDWPDDLRTRSLAGYLLVRGQGGVLAGYSAALLCGVDCAPRGAPAEVLITGDARAHPGLRVSRGRVDDLDLAVVHSCRMTRPVRTAWDLARRLPLLEAVVAVDGLARQGRFDPAELLARRRDGPGARGCRRLDAVVDLADPRAESPPETRLRVLVVRAGLPKPEVQYEVRDEYGFTLARADLAYPDARLAIEYDGAVHFDRLHNQRDQDRDARLASHGWLTLWVRADGLGKGALNTVARIARTLAIRLAARYAGIEMDREAVFALL
ncbi:hypothetical protein GCM10023321_02520 [Pseudonocardia eucalypti]|uniref:DUF559 domain-containing protein n=1 Tax=Pseudonocardia eucalypti TaxID=648755 RepID=A0ABP9PE39_9PSEU|nr:hypothetical protein [Pseudonocardia eucalypti]